jgi:SRSO17 transposase
VKTNLDAVAAAHSLDPAAWWQVFDDVLARISTRFARSETRRTVGELLLGLLSQVERKNGWSLAEHAGHRTPDRMQRLLRTAVWDTEQVGEDLRDLVVEQFGHPDAVLAVDETGFLKKGVCSVGVQRQYTGTAGRIENSQVGVFLAYISPAGRAPIDRRLYLHRSWSDSESRCTVGGVPDSVDFATKPELALDMIAQAVQAGVPAGFVTADEAYGLDPLLAAGLRGLGLGYVLAVACDRRIQITPAYAERADQVAAHLTDQAWETRSCGPGSKGDRLYDWAWVHIHADGPGRHTLLIRRGGDGVHAFYLCWTPNPVALVRLIVVAGSRWSIEETFQAAKGQVGLDHYQCRGWTAWHRYTLLAMLALTILIISSGHDPLPHRPDVVKLSIPELRRLIAATLLLRAVNPPHILAWSLWRRRHQATARHSHYKRRNHPLPAPTQ